MRVNIYLQDEQVASLAKYCAEEGISRTAAIRRGIRLLLERDRQTVEDRPAERGDALDAAFGMWKDRGIDALAYERKLRDEWERDVWAL